MMLFLGSSKSRMALPVVLQSLCFLSPNKDDHDTEEEVCAQLALPLFCVIVFLGGSPHIYLYVSSLLLHKGQGPVNSINIHFSGKAFIVQMARKEGSGQLYTVAIIGMDCARASHTSLFPSSPLLFLDVSNQPEIHVSVAPCLYLCRT